MSLICPTESAGEPRDTETQHLIIGTIMVLKSARKPRHHMWVTYSDVEWQSEIDALEQHKAIFLNMPAHQRILAFSAL
jgi:hypothetical protein